MRTKLGRARQRKKKQTALRDKEPQLSRSPECIFFLAKSPTIAAHRPSFDSGSRSAPTRRVRPADAGESPPAAAPGIGSLWVLIGVRGVLLGVSPRGTLALYRAAQARAAIQGRDFVLPDDVKQLAPFVLTHRIVVDGQSRLRGRKPDNVLQDVLERTPVPVDSL